MPGENPEKAYPFHSSLPMHQTKSSSILLNNSRTRWIEKSKKAENFRFGPRNELMERDSFLCDAAGREGSCYCILEERGGERERERERKREREREADRGRERERHTHTERDGWIDR